VAIETLSGEKELLSRVSLGDSEAFGLLFERYYGRIYSVAFQYLKIHEPAEDLVQLSFLRIWEKRRYLPEIERFDAYLFKIARNELTDQFRKRANQETYQLRIQQLFEEEQGNPEELLINKQKLSHIAEAIARLPAQQQQAYRLSRDKGLSYNEIADEMKVSVNTVRKHISLALSSIREFFRIHRNDFLILIAWLIYQN
jgi:RNA polymerase sigma-70 factor (family 1)